MKTFIHKKTGEVATYEDGILKSSGFTIELGVEPSNKFWEKIIEKKEYEILKVYNSLHIISQSTNITRWLDDGYKIYSVKRLSDGEIFTIGDIVDINNTDSLSAKNLKITGFCISNILSVLTNDKINNDYLGGKGFNISIAKHSEKNHYLKQKMVLIFMKVIVL